MFTWQMCFLKVQEHLILKARCRVRNIYEKEPDKGWKIYENLKYDKL